uniref:Podocan like 1 n=2 Tax=Bos TaxID=9903 RepID=A0AAA9T5A0_BOVIN
MTLPSPTWGRAPSPHPGPAPHAAPAPGPTRWTATAWTSGCSRTTSPGLLSTSPCRTTSSRSSPTTSCHVSAGCGPSTSTTTSSPLRLSVAPQFLPRSLRVADLAANEVTEIFPLTFGEKPALRSVYLHNNQLSNAGLPPDAFRGSEAVATLSLSSNQLSYVPPSLPPSLERLHLQNNLISKVPRGALSRQTHLRELYLQHNQLTDSGLDATTFSKLHRLEYLDLSHNQLAAVPAGLPRTLAVLHLGRNRIRWVEAARLGGLRGLRYLLLQHNQLGATGLPAGALRPLRGLHTLHLYGNRLDRVPQALPRRLRALVLPHNRVAALGARDLTSTPRLAELNLAYNCLASARVHLRAFRRLRALRSLDLAGNQLTQLPSGLPAGLHTLRLQRNQLRTLEPEPLAGLHQLQELSLAHNRLRVGGIGPGTWHELQALQVRGRLVGHTIHRAAPSPLCLLAQLLPWKALKC